MADQKQMLDINLNMSDGSGDEEEYQDHKRRRYHRHTPDQIQKLEEFFKDYPHPTKKQRSELSQELDMEPLQIKFWFQNKRTQMKSKYERQGNMELRAENDRLREENQKLKEAVRTSICPSCGSKLVLSDHFTCEDFYLRMENNRLRHEIDRISAIAARCVGKAVAKSDVASTSKANNY